jgi:hypothetical protein
MFRYLKRRTLEESHWNPGRKDDPTVIKLLDAGWFFEVAGRRQRLEPSGVSQVFEEECEVSPAPFDQAKCSIDIILVDRGPLGD